MSFEPNRRLQYAISDWSMVYDNTPCIQEIEEALRDGADINHSEFSTRNTPLCTALQRGYLDLVKLLIDKGADPNKETYDGYTPLTYCIVQNINTELVSFLIEMGANVCKPDQKRNKTPLSMAASRKNLPMIDFLLNNGATFNIQTAFLDAIQSEALMITKYLITKGASVNFKYRKGYTPLIAAVERKNLPIIEELFENGARVNELDNKGRSPLIKSIDTSRIDIFKKLIEAGADVNLPDTRGTYPLVKSIEMNNFEMVKILVEEGSNAVDLNVINECGRTALTKAVTKEYARIVKYLIEHGADVNQVDNNQETALSTAAANSNIVLFEFLIESGANVDLAMPEIEKVARNNDDFFIYFQKLLEKLEQEEIQTVNVVENGGHEGADL